MAVPSVMKIKKGNVEFESHCDRANYCIRELTRAAMKDVGRYILSQVAPKVRGISKLTRKMRYAPKRYQMWVRSQECDLQLGIENTKYGAKSAWWADQAELGTHKQPKRGILTTTVQDNIAMIRTIESQYLSAIEDEARALSMCDEQEAQEGAE